MTVKIVTVNTDEEIQACFHVLAQLRPHVKEEEFLNLIRGQFKSGYLLTTVISNNTVVAVAGFYLRENIAWGKHLYVEDFVSEQKQRSKGLGHKLLDWLHNEAKEKNCGQLHLDSGIQRKDAHRFYEREGMMFTSHHYASQI